MSEKAFGQVFTPKAIVKQMLDTVGYVEDSGILHKTIMEPSFGAGVFLEEIVSRLIRASEQHGYSPRETSETLSHNIYGVELDPVLYHSTIDSLNALVEQHNLPAVDWKLEQGDTMVFKDKYSGTFDFVVGNPPYVRIHNIPEEQRELVKKFRFATGTTDLYIVFFELGLEFLNGTGKLAYITPNSFMKNHSQQGFRKHLVESRLVAGLSDYRSEKIFSDADTYATITYLGNVPSETVAYSLMENGVTTSSTVEYDSLLATAGSQWNFADPEKIMSQQALLPRAVDDVMNVQYGIATLRDKLYIDASPVIGTETTVFHGHLIENGILRPAVKGSTYKGGEIMGRAIFPYHLDTERYVPMDEEYLKTTFPLAYAYLSFHRSELAQRSMEKKSMWYQYGRSQGLNATDKPKLVFGHVIKPTAPIHTHLVPAGTIVYSGFFSVPKQKCDIDLVRTHLESLDFVSYAKTVGKDMAGGFVSITAKHLKSYRF
ncbi:MAG: N-6 DNA methylase [Enterococcus sp.]|nr:N-6 DNA methylase [Enterococcus sp.]